VTLDIVEFKLKIMLDPTKTYSRKSSIVYDENDIQIVKFEEIFPDFDKLSEQAINYLNRYIEMFPNKIEIFKPEEEKQQLTLF
jgi:uncharacterized protein YfbU (UPF0304 family)